MTRWLVLFIAALTWMLCCCLVWALYVRLPEMWPQALTVAVGLWVQLVMMVWFSIDAAREWANR